MSQVRFARAVGFEIQHRGGQYVIVEIEVTAKSVTVKQLLRGAGKGLPIRERYTLCEERVDHKGQIDVPLRYVGERSPRIVIALRPTPEQGQAQAFLELRTFEGQVLRVFEKEGVFSLQYPDCFDVEDTVESLFAALKAGAEAALGSKKKSSRRAAKATK